MADTEEPQFNTLKERIAALNRQKNFNSADPAPRKKPPPPPPPGQKKIEQTPVAASSPVTVPPRPARSAAPPLPRRDTQTSQSNGEVTSRNDRPQPPALPVRTPSSQAAPALPRRTSTQSGLLSARRNSASSEISQHSNVSSTSLGRTASSTTSYSSNGSGPRKMAPATFDPASLPPLPPSRRESEIRAKEEAAKDAAAKETASREARERQAAKAREAASASRPSPSPSSAAAQAEARPSLPPRLPSRPARPSSTAPTQTASEEAKSEPRKLPYGTIKGFGSGQSTKTPSVPSQRPQAKSQPSRGAGTEDDAPPPIPVSSRPSAAQIQAASTRSAPRLPKDENNCWDCRDWSEPDAVAAQFPRESLPQKDVVGYLAQGLCGPFASYDDKARAIFTWFHHNIMYDTKAFFNNTVRSMSVEETISRGAAVCQGYADTYKAIANRAGLDCVVVCGHGKGFGYKALKKGEKPPPAKPDGHAWNAVRVDGGAWKLLDACWGAGHICGAANLFKKQFSPQQFTASNERFGIRHFPQDPKYQFRSDGRPISWEEYYTEGIDGPPRETFGEAQEQGIAVETLEPKSGELSVYSGEVVRFQFARACEHWSPEKSGLGKPSLILMSIQGQDGRNKDMIPLETNGYWSWLDIKAQDLGAPGQTVELIKMNTFGDEDAKGLTKQQFLAKKGRVGYSYAYLAKWQLV